MALPLLLVVFGGSSWRYRSCFGSSVVLLVVPVGVTTFFGGGWVGGVPSCSRCVVTFLLSSVLLLGQVGAKEVCADGRQT